MDTNTFYSVTAATCFALVGLWWTVVKDKSEWFKTEATTRMAAGVYASFLIPALMSLGAQVGGNNPLIWQGVFVIASVAGIRYSSKLVKLVREFNPKGPFSKRSWMVPFLYGFILLFAIFPGLGVIITGLEPLQLEGLLLCVLILAAHTLAWEFTTVQAARKE
jgi:hypothetical protein